MNGSGNIAGVLLILVLIWLAVLAFVVINIFKRPDLSLLGKVIWAFIIFSAPVLGLIVYLLIGRRGLKSKL